MTTPEHAADRTRLMARAIGPFFTIVPATIAARASDMKVLVDRFEADPMWPWVLGAMLLIGGCIIIALHQYWRGAAAIIVSLLGWFRAECEMSAVRPAMGTEPVAAAVAVATQA